MGILRMSMGSVGGVWSALRVTLAAIVMLIAAAAPALADVTYPTRPMDRGFIADEAKLISPEDATKIKAIGDRLLTEKRVPLIVCTITSMADHGASGWTIERYAMNVFDEWGIGSKSYDYGILLLVSKGDRKARIELGSGWTRERDSAAASIMSMDIVPAFKRGEYSAGILKGVQQLDALARVASKPAPPANQDGAGSSPGAASTTSVPVPQARGVDVNVGREDAQQQQQYSYSNSYSRGRSSGGSGIGGFSMACLMIPVIGIIIVLRVLKGAIGWGGGGSGWGRSMYPGGYYGGGWGSGSSFGGGGGGGWSGGSSGGGGGFSGGSFGGGSSGGGGATGSW